MKLLHPLVLGIWLLFAGSTGYAQQFTNIEFWGDEEGLKTRGITHVVQDNEGFIWLGTYNGLIRFDGRSFVSFGSILEGHRLGTENIFGLVIRDKQLWIAAECGLFLFETNTFQLKQVGLPDTKKQMHLDNRINNIALMPSGRLIAGGQNGCVWIENKQRAWELLTCFAPNTGSISNFTFDKAGNIWFYNQANTVYRYHPASGEIKTMYRGNTDIHYITYTPQFGIVLKISTTLYNLDTNNQHITQLKQPLLWRGSYIAPVDDNSYWLTRHTKELYYCTGNRNINLSFVFNKIATPNYRILSLTKIKNTLWIGTNYGILRILISNNPIKYFYATEPGNPDKTNTSVRAMCEGKDGTLYFASYNGLFKINRPLEHPGIQPLVLDTVEPLIPYCLQWFNNKLLIGTEGAGIAWYEPQTRKLIKKGIHDSLKRYRSVYSMALTRDKKSVICGTGNGVIKYRITDGSYTPLRLKHNNSKLNDGTVYQILPYKNKYLLATTHGLLYCDTQMNVQHFIDFKGKPVYSLLVDSFNDLVWAGTGGEGLFRIDHNYKLTQYHTHSGLPDNRIASLVKRGHQLLIGTYNGLSVFNMNQPSFLNFHTDQGLSSNEFNHAASYVTQKGEIIMGGMNGYNLIPQDLSDYALYPTEHPKPVISSIYILNGKEEKRIYQCKNLNELWIPVNNKILEFEFGMPDYNQPNKCLFAYKLKGLDKDWIELGTRNYLRLSELKAGKYSLMLKAAGSNGIWYTMPYHLNIEVETVIYQRWWFIMIAVLVLAAAIVLFYRSKLNNVKRILNLRLQISSDLHDEVGSILTAVGMQAEVLHMDGTEETKPALKQIAETSRQAVTNMRDVVWSIDSSHDKVQDMVDRMKDYQSILFDSGNTDVHFTTEIEDPNQQLDLVTRQNTYLIYKETLNNIAKHAHATEIQIHLSINEKQLVLKVSNNGKASSANSPGMGLLNMEMRAKKMKAKLTINKEAAYETTLVKKFR